MKTARYKSRIIATLSIRKTMDNCIPTGKIQRSMMVGGDQAILKLSTYVLIPPLMFLH
jgi:hypothetical protein